MGNETGNETYDGYIGSLRKTESRLKILFVLRLALLNCLDIVILNDVLIGFGIIVVYVDTVENTL